MRQVRHLAVHPLEGCHISVRCLRRQPHSEVVGRLVRVPPKIHRQSRAQQHAETAFTQSTKLSFRRGVQLRRVRGVPSVARSFALQHSQHQLAYELRSSVRVIMSDFLAVSDQLHVDQVPQLLDIFVSGLHRIDPREFGCVVHEAHDVLVSLTTLAVDKHGDVHRNVVTQLLAANRVELLENRSCELRSGTDVAHVPVVLLVLAYVLLFDLQASDKFRLHTLDQRSLVLVSCPFVHESQHVGR